VVSPAGSTLDEFWAELVAGRQTNAELITYEAMDGLPVLSCRARSFTPEDRLERHELRRLDRLHHMAIWAADDALAQAGPGPAPDRCAVVVGLGYGAAEFLEAQTNAFNARGLKAVSPLTIPVVMPNSVAAHLSLRYGYRGPSFTHASACAAGAVAIGEALWLLRTGRVDRVLAGGVDAMLTAGVAGFFSRMEAMSTRYDEPTAASRPFDVDRDGLVLGEGAGFVVLERSAAGVEAPLGTILGYATNSDAFHIVAPREDGSGAADCMRAALADAGLEASDIGHINAHGTSTKRNDHAEALAIRSVFGDRPVPVTSNKGVIGHLLGGAGAVEAIATLLSTRHGVVPPIANLTNPDPDCPLLLADRPMAPSAPVGLTNSFAFGGHNASLIVGR
jgi:3-oxoacyl-[acyl-carrier-protein] synthase II